jgi:hypothetical protein
MTATKTTTFDRKAIMQAAHFMARWRVASCGGSYREWFAKALRTEWKRAGEAKARHEQNVGLPIRTCFADKPAYVRRFPLRGNATIAHMIAA